MNAKLVRAIVAAGIVHVYMTRAVAQVYVPGEGHTLTELALRQISTSAEVGTLPGMHGVSPSGGATYTIPIDVPPGTNGMVPSLAFSYNSHAGNGLMGKGWGLSGLSAIVRTGRDNYHDGVIQPIEYGPGDRFMLDGQRLVCTSGTYGAVGSAYDTEHASFLTVSLLSFGGGNQAFCWFQVVTKEGMTMEYGLDWFSKTLNDEEDAVMTWRLNRVIDPFGNYMTYVYSEDEDRLLVSVRYTGNEATGLQPYNRIDFEYTERSDVSTRFAPGGRSGLNKLLSSVNVTAEGNLVRRYTLSYAWRDHRGSYLNDITMVGADGTSSFNATQLAFDDLPNAPSEESTTTINDPGIFDVFTGDFDGNGMTDLVIAEVGWFEGVRFHERLKIHMNGSANSSFTIDPLELLSFKSITITITTFSLVSLEDSLLPITI